MSATSTEAKRAGLGLCTIDAGFGELYPGEPQRPCGPLEAYDPVRVERPGLITRQTPVGAMGSCFAVEIRAWLQKHGYNVLEVGTGAVPRRTIGSIYHTPGLRQAMAMALGEFEPREAWWPCRGRMTDPYRRKVFWESQEEMRAERATYGRDLRAFLEGAEVFIVTLGMSEVWRSRVDHETFCVPPEADQYDPDRHETHMLTVEENVAELERAHAMFRRVNADAPWIMTLSPVPLVRSARPEGIVVADCLSKATLRVSIDQFMRAHAEDVLYFPSYEIVTKLTPTWGYRKDNRHVTRETVARIMRLFMQHFGDVEATEAAAMGALPEPVARPSHADAFRERYVREVWRRLAREAAGRPIAIYGAGAHTRWLASVVRDIDDGPRVGVVLDDAPGEAREIMGAPVHRPDDADPAGYAAVLVSSDSLEDALATRAHAWATRAPESSRPAVLRLYDGLGPGPFASGTMVA